MSQYIVNEIVTNTIADYSDVSKKIIFDHDVATHNTHTNFRFNRTTNQDLTVPDTISDTLICCNTSNILQNKTLLEGSTIIANDLDQTKKLMFEIDSTPNSTTKLHFDGDGDTTITVPSSVSDTIITKLNVSNIGSGTSLYNDADTSKTLQFKKINYNSNKLSITDTSDTINLDVVTGSTSDTVAVGNDNRFSDAKIIIVKMSNPGEGEFTSVAAAVNSITDASSDNLYVVKIGPGIYTEPEINVPSYVCVTGSTIMQTVIQPDTQDHHVFIINQYVEISYFTIQNSGPGYAGIASIDAGDYSQAHKISIVDCDIAVLVVSDTIDCMCYLEYVDINGLYSSGLKVQSLSGKNCFVNTENYYLLPGAPIGVHTTIDGTGAYVRALTTGTIGYESTGIGYYVTNGGKLKLVGIYVQNVEHCIVCDNGSNIELIGGSFDSSLIDIRVLNIGLPSTVTITSVASTYRATTFVSIEHPDTNGYFIGAIADMSKFFVHPLSPFSIKGSKTNILTVGFRDAAFSSIGSAVNTINPIISGVLTNGLTTITSSAQFNVSMSGFVITGTGIQTNTIFTFIDAFNGTLSLPATLTTISVCSIIRATASNIYTIEVSPGTYTENPFTLPKYVNITGYFIDAVVINAGSDAYGTTLITCSEFTSINNLTIFGSNVAGSILIKYQGGTHGGHCRIDAVCFGSSDTLISADSTRGYGIFVVNDIIIKGAVDIKNGIVIRDQFPYPLFVLITNMTWTPLTPFVSFESFIDIKGSSPYTPTLFSYITGVKLAQVLANPVQGSGVIIDGAMRLGLLGCTFTGIETGFHVKNVSSNSPNIIVEGCIYNENTNDIIIDNPTTRGSLNIAANINKIIIEPNTNILINFVDFTNGSKGFTGNFLQGHTINNMTNITEQIQKGSSTLGLINGGEISSYSDSSLDIAVNNGTGYVMVDNPPNDYLKYITWDNTIVTLNASSDNWLYVNNAGTFLISSSIPSELSTILIARFITTNTGVLFIQKIPKQANHTATGIDTLLRDVFGPIFKSGCIISPGTSDLHISVSAGNYWHSCHEFMPASTTDITMIAYYRNGSGGSSVTNLTEIPLQWDNNSGTLQNITSNNWIKHTLYVVGDDTDQVYILIYGQTQFATELAAQQAELAIPPSYFSSDTNIAPIAAIVVTDTDTTLNSTRFIDIRPTLAFKADGITASTDHNSLINLTVGDAHPQYFRTDGTRTMSGNINMGGNSINNVNLVDGIDVTLHASRHAPNGSDPLPTATAVTIGTANSAGIGTAFSRADHVHQGVASVCANNGTVRYGQLSLVNGTGMNITDNNGAFTFDVSRITPELEVTSGIGLIANYAAGRFSLNGVITNLSVGTVALTPLTTNGIIYVNSDGIVVQSVNTTFPNNSIPLATYTTNTNSIISLTDARSVLNDNNNFGSINNVSNITATSTLSAGTLDQIARIDHVHTISTAVPIAQLTDQSNAIGTSASLARSDHVHNIATDAPVSIGSINSQGTSSTFVKSDHVHQGIHSISANGGTQRFGDQTLQQGTGISITDNGSGTFTIANLGNGSAELVVTIGSSLTANYTAGRVMINGIVYNISSGSITLTGSVSNGIIYVNTSGVVTQGQGSSFPANTVPIATFVTSISTITSITDARIVLNENSQFGSVGNVSNITSTGIASAGTLDQVARIDHAHTISTAAPIAQLADQSNNIGTSTSVARSDHVHNIATDTPVSIGTTNSKGTATTFVKSDHVHQGIHSISANGGTQRFGDQNLQQGTGISITDNSTGTFTIANSGNGNAELVVTIGSGLIANYTAGRVKVIGTITSISAGSITLSASMSNGTIYVNTSGSVAQGTTFPANSIPLATFVTSISTITSITDARTVLNENAQYGIVGNVSNITSTGTASAGTLDQAARIDHVHTISTAAPIAQLADQSNAIGTSTSVARSDHVHNIATATPVSIGIANSQGTATTLVKSDHVHQGIHSINANGGTQRYGDITLQQGSNVTLTDNGSGIITVGAVIGVITTSINILADQKPSGTSGGTFTTGAWQTRILNTISGTGNISLASNQFTFPAGTYIINAICPAYKVGSHQCRLYNVTDSTVVDYGTNAFANSSSSNTAATTSIMYTYLVISSPKVLRIEHYCSSTQTNDGFGLPCSFGIEVYTVVTVSKVA
jgi:hypothetical protein